jgi:hypothetical protein
VTTRQVTINVPNKLYNRLRERAERSHLTLEDQVLQALRAMDASTDASDDEVLASWEPKFAQLQMLDDDALWRAARSGMPRPEARRLESLNHKQSSEGLTDAESRRQRHLLRRYEWFMLLRAHAAALLKERGHDLSSLIQPIDRI